LVWLPPRERLNADSGADGFFLLTKSEAQDGLVCLKGKPILAVKVSRHDSLAHHILAQRAFGVAGNAKMFEEWFDVTVEQSLGRPIFQCGCRHVVFPCLACLPV
jgi:hypothetical protein